MTRYLPDSMPCGRNSAGTTNSGGPASNDDSGTSNPSYDRKLGTDEGMELTLSSESLEIEVSAVHFLMKLAQVAAQVYPLDNKVLESTRFKENTIGWEMYKLICHLFVISGGHKWSDYSVQSWLTAGSWYLSSVSTTP